MSISSCLGYLQIWKKNYESGYCMYSLLQSSSAHDNWKKNQLNCQLVIILKYFAHVFVEVPHQRAVSCDWAVAHFIVHSACSRVLWVFPHNRDLELILKKVRIVSNPKRTVLIYWWLLKWSVGRSVIRPVIRPAKWRQIHACLLCTIYLSPALFFPTL